MIKYIQYLHKSLKYTCIYVLKKKRQSYHNVTKFIRNYFHTHVQQLVHVLQFECFICGYKIKQISQTITLH